MNQFSNNHRTTMNIQQIIQGLERVDGNFPGEEIAAAREQKNEITPELIKLINNTVDNIEQVLQEEDYLAYLYAIFLLAEFRQQTAMESIIKMLSLPEETTWELLGDIITEDLGRILASISGGAPEGLYQLIENDGLDDLIRAAAMDALLILMVENELFREELIAYFESLFQFKLEKNCGMVWNHLVVCSVNIYPVELTDLIKQSYEKELVDDEFIPYDQVEEALQSGKDIVLDWLNGNPSYSLVTDAITEINRWMD